MSTIAELLMKRSTIAISLIPKDEPCGSMKGKQKIEGVFQLVNFNMKPGRQREKPQ